MSLPHGPRPAGSLASNRDGTASPDTNPAISEACPYSPRHRSPLSVATMLVRHQVLTVLAGAAFVRAQAAAANGTTRATTVQTAVEVSQTTSSNTSAHRSGQTATSTRTAATQVAANASETGAAELGWSDVRAPNVPPSQQYTVAVSRGRSFSPLQERGSSCADLQFKDYVCKRSSDLLMCTRADPAP